MVKNGDAYVDFSTQAEMKRQRGYKNNGSGSKYGNPYPSPYRISTIDSNIDNFQNMIDGKYKEGECCLRMKMNPTSDNPNMRDLVAYTIKYTPHYRTKNKYCVYPSYEFAHCIVDALEKIDYSYCSLEFVTRQESYYWVLEKLNLHKPKVYEFSRLNFENSLLSKRKIKSLIEDGKLDGWDDPRLLTIKGLRSRGYTANALKECVKTTNHTRSISTLSIKFLESFIRDDLNKNAPRIFAVFDPVKVVIDNISEDEIFTFDRPTHPHRKSDSDTRKIKLQREIWIDRSDFRPEANRKYYRLTKKQNIRLKYTEGLLKYKSHTLSDNNLVDIIHTEYIPDKTTRVKGCISWLSNDYSKLSNFRMFEGNLLVDNNFNNESEKTITGLIETGIPEGTYQVERFGYFNIRKNDINQIVPLREDKNK